MAPSPRSTIFGASAAASARGVQTLVSKTHRASARSPATQLRAWMLAPALFTRTSTLPSSRSACAATSDARPGSARSAGRITGRSPPSAAISSARLRRRSSRRATSASRAPLPASRLAAARPIPLDAPVSTTPFPAIDPIGPPAVSTARSKQPTMFRPIVRIRWARMPRRAKVRPDEPGREKLLEAGRELFGRQGYDATSVAEIGARAQIAKSVLYHYFGSKAALYRAVIQADGKALVDAVATAVPPAGDPGERLRPGIDAYLRFLAEHPDTWRLMTRDPPTDRAVRRSHERVAEKVTEALRSLLAHPGKSKGKPYLVELVALSVRTYAEWWQRNPRVPREEIVEAIGDLAAAGARRISG